MFLFHPKPEVKQISLIGKTQIQESMLTKIPLIFQTIENIWFFFLYISLNFPKQKTVVKKNKLCYKASAVIVLCNPYRRTCMTSCYSICIYTLFYIWTENLALLKPAWQSSTLWSDTADRAVDGLYTDLSEGSVRRQTWAKQQQSGGWIWNMYTAYTI